VSTTTTTWKQKRGKLARLSQDLPAGHPELELLRRDIAVDRLAEHVREVVSRAPELTPEQRDRIAAILRGGASS
jgi:hypothetical protein